MHRRADKKSKWGRVTTRQKIEPVQEKYRIENKEDQIVHQRILD